MFVTVISTVPAFCGGAAANSDVLELIWKKLAATAPNETPVTLVKFVPVMVMPFPPPVEPLVSLKAVTVGGTTGTV